MLLGSNSTLALLGSDGRRIIHRKCSSNYYFFIHIIIRIFHPYFPKEFHPRSSMWHHVETLDVAECGRNRVETLSGVFFMCWVSHSFRYIKYRIFNRWSLTTDTFLGRWPHMIRKALHYRFPHFSPSIHLDFKISRWVLGERVVLQCAELWSKWSTLIQSLHTRILRFHFTEGSRCICVTIWKKHFWWLSSFTKVSNMKHDNLCCCNNSPIASVISVCLEGEFFRTWVHCVESAKAWSLTPRATVLIAEYASHKYLQTKLLVMVSSLRPRPIAIYTRRDNFIAGKELVGKALLEVADKAEDRACLFRMWRLVCNVLWTGKLKSLLELWRVFLCWEEQSWRARLKDSFGTLLWNKSYIWRPSSKFKNLESEQDSEVGIIQPCNKLCSQLGIVQVVGFASFHPQSDIQVMTHFGHQADLNDFQIYREKKATFTNLGQICLTLCLVLVSHLRNRSHP